jgi:hypothetical protein
MGEIEEIGIEEARKTLGDLCNRAEYQGATTHLTRNGRITAVLAPPGYVTAAPVVWSVVRGDSPTARAVEPGIAGVNVPTEILAWAETHGMDGDDPDVYILATPGDEAGEVPGEIAHVTTLAATTDVALLRAELDNL